MHVQVLTRRGEAPPQHAYTSYTRAVGSSEPEAVLEFDSLLLIGVPADSAAVTVRVVSHAVAGGTEIATFTADPDTNTRWTPDDGVSVTRYDEGEYRRIVASALVESRWLVTDRAGLVLGADDLRPAEPVRLKSGETVMQGSRRWVDYLLNGPLRDGSREPPQMNTAYWHQITPDDLDTAAYSLADQGADTHATDLLCSYQVYRDLIRVYGGLPPWTLHPLPTLADSYVVLYDRTQTAPDGLPVRVVLDSDWGSNP